MSRQDGWSLTEVLVVLLLTTVFLGLGVYGWREYRLQAAQAAVHTVLWQVLGDVQAEGLTVPRQLWDEMRWMQRLADYSLGGTGYHFEVREWDSVVYVLAVPQDGMADWAWAEPSRGVYWCAPPQTASAFETAVCRPSLGSL